MNEHISYAMRNTEATQAWLSVNSPYQLLDWSHLAVESLFGIGFLLAALHAWKTYRATGSASAPLTLLAAFVYGLCMDILSYYTVENFWHGEFSVMLLFNRLPLYITFLYPAILYHAIMTIRRYGFSKLNEAIFSGILSGMLYMIFDNFGPMVGWWIWDTSDPTTFPYIGSVPLTSYAWMFLFSSSFTFINSTFSWDWVAQGKSTWKLVLAQLLQPLATIFLGVLLFIPHNLFAQSSPPYDMLPWDADVKMAALLYALMFGSVCWQFLMKWRKPQQERDALLMAFPFIYLMAFVYMYISKFQLFISARPEGLTQDGLVLGNLIVVVFALIVSATILLLSHPVPKR